MKRILRALPMILLCFLPYLFLYGATRTEGKFLFPAMVWWYVSIAASVFCMVYAFLLPKFFGAFARQLLFWDMFVKICHVPLFVTIFVLYAMTIMISFYFLPLAWFIEYFIVLSSSSLGISGLIRARRDGLVSGTFLGVNIFLHFLFCLDVVSAIWSYVHVRRTEKTRAIFGNGQRYY